MPFQARPWIKLNHFLQISKLLHCCSLQRQREHFPSLSFQQLISWQQARVELASSSPFLQHLPSLSLPFQPTSSSFLPPLWPWLLPFQLISWQLPLPLLSSFSPLRQLLQPFSYRPPLFSSMPRVTSKIRGQLRLSSKPPSFP